MITALAIIGGLTLALLGVMAVCYVGVGLEDREHPNEKLDN